IDAEFAGVTQVMQATRIGAEDRKGDRCGLCQVALRKQHGWLSIVEANTVHDRRGHMDRKVSLDISPESIRARMRGDVRHGAPYRSRERPGRLSSGKRICPVGIHMHV